MKKSVILAGLCALSIWATGCCSSGSCWSNCCFSSKNSSSKVDESVVAEKAQPTAPITPSAILPERSPIAPR